MNWTDDRTAELKRLWAEGRTAGDVAKMMGGGVSRNMVIGKVHRLGLASRPCPIGKPFKRSGGRKKEQIEADVHVPESSSVADLIEGEAFSYSRPKVRVTKVNGPIRVKPRARPASLFRTCQWIDGLPSSDDACKCGEPTAPGRPYCQAHEARAYSRRAA